MNPRHTIVVSDLHLSDEEPVDPLRPLWKRFKQRDVFLDDTFARFVEFVRTEVPGPIEMVLNGDIFDFDSIMAQGDGQFSTSWLERLRGLAPEEDKSAFKMARIVADHPIWVQAVSALIADGHEIVFVVGNHDLELHWPKVQATLRDALGDPEGRLIRFCEWFAISQGDTLIEHGNQFDPYCLCQDPIHPLVGPHDRPRVRLPFGNLAGKLMLNGMGLFNPHVTVSYIRGSLWEYLQFFYSYLLRTQPLLLWTWLWSALVTLVISLREGFLPALHDPLFLEERVQQIAERSRATPGQVRSLRLLKVHPAIFNPWKIARELWIDRAVLLALVVWVSFQIYSVASVFSDVSFWWLAIPLGVLLAPFLFYARTVESDTDEVERLLHERMPVAARITRVSRVVLGHTHRAVHEHMGDLELLNPGTWSPAFEDPECTIRHGRTCFVWIKPTLAGTRIAELWSWTDPGTTLIAPQQVEPPAPRLRDAFAWWARP